MTGEISSEGESPVVGTGSELVNPSPKKKDDTHHS